MLEEFPSFRDMCLMAAGQKTDNGRKQTSIAGIAAAWVSAGLVAAGAVSGILFAILTLYAYPLHLGNQLHHQLQDLLRINASLADRQGRLQETVADQGVQVRMLLNRMRRIHMRDHPLEFSD